METMGNLRRSDYCGELRMKDIEREVVLMGWVQTQRNLGQLIFVDIRDISGISQVVFDETITKDVFEKAKGLKGEYVIAVRGKVRERSQKNPHIPTGDIEILISISPSGCWASFNFRPLSVIICLAKSMILTDSPISNTNTSPPLPIAPA